MYTVRHIRFCTGLRWSQHWEFHNSACIRTWNEKLSTWNHLTRFVCPTVKMISGNFFYNFSLPQKFLIMLLFSQNGIEYCPKFSEYWTALTAEAFPPWSWLELLHEDVQLGQGPQLQQVLDQESSCRCPDFHHQKDIQLVSCGFHLHKCKDPKNFERS